MAGNAEVVAFACEYEQSLRVLKRSPRELQEPRYQVDLDGNALAAVLRKERDWLRRTVATYNKRPPSSASLARFLNHCQILFDHTERILSIDAIREVIGFSRDAQYLLQRERASYRLTISVQQVLDTGVNVAVFGEAGAGKTTSLQMYAARLLDKGSGAITLFAPLSHVVRTWGRVHVKAGETPSLEDGLTKYLNALGCDVSRDWLREKLKTLNSVVLLDGIDEAIKRAPWILGAIRSLAQRHPKLQVITSSRMSGAYLDDVPFLGVTLLPFTQSQVQEFVRKWFDGTGDHHARRIERHLKKKRELSAIISNPLLATVLCTLEEHDVPLPDTELRLYDERMRLLTGFYHMQKHGIRSSVRELARYSRKLAVALHEAGKREERIEWYYKRASLIKRTGKHDGRQIVDELCDPCNVLIPMTEDGKIGFGHLRYQEFLVANELIRNRAINLIPRLSDTWWKGTFILFAQLIDDMDWLIGLLTRNGALSTCIDTLSAMIAARPKAEQKKLHTAVDTGLEFERQEHLTKWMSEDTDDDDTYEMGDL